MNKVILTGRLTRDPEIRYTKSGKAVASFSLAVDRPISKKNQHEGQQTADFIPCIAWERHADFAGNHLIKGSPVLIEGRMQVRNYEDQQGGQHWITEVVVSSIEFNGPRPGGNNAPAGGQMNGTRPPAQAAPQQAPQAGGFAQIPLDEEIPF